MQTLTIFGDGNVQKRNLAIGVVYEEEEEEDEHELTKQMKDIKLS